MHRKQPSDIVEHVRSAESTESSTGRRRKRNYFSLVNVDSISLGIDSVARVASRGCFDSSDNFDEPSGESILVLSHEGACFICLQDFEVTGGKRPVRLRCGHSICIDCEGCLYNTARGLRCPVCAHISHHPHAVNAPLIQTLNSKDVQIQRRVCAECGLGKIAVFCEDCVLPLCRDCDSAVHHQKPFLKHKRGSAEVAPVNRALLTKCRLHFEEFTDYCAPCGEVLCPSCVRKEGGHDGHDIHRLAEVVPAQREELTRLSDQSEAAEEVFAGTLQAVQEGLGLLSASLSDGVSAENTVRRTRDDINAHFDGIISKLQARRTQLLHQVDIITEHKVTSLRSQQAALSQHLSRAYLAACRGRVTVAAGSNVAVADSFEALRHHLSSIANTDMSATAMHEPVVDFLVPEFHGPAEIDITKIGQYGAVGGPRAIQGVTCQLSSVGSTAKLRWPPVQSRGRHVARSIEIQMSVKGTSRSPLTSSSGIVRAESYELSDDEADAQTRNLIEFIHEYSTVGEVALEETEFSVDLSQHHHQWVYFRVRIVDSDLNLTGPWSAPCSLLTPRTFGTVLLFRSSFDEGGLMRFLATLGGLPMSNPILRGDVVVIASSYGESMYTVDGAGIDHSMSKVGWLTAPIRAAQTPGFSSGNPPPLEKIALLASESPPPGWTLCTEDSPGSWVCIDIGPERLLKISHYCLRNGAAVFQAPVSAVIGTPTKEEAGIPKLGGRSGGSFQLRSQSSFSKFQDGPLPFSLAGSGGGFDKCATLRSWHLQGRLREGGDWVTLCVHTRADKDLLPDVPYISGSWKVSAKLGAYRFFRVLQTGKNSIGSDVLSISGIDLYGTLF